MASPLPGNEDSHSYFVPMVDMLAGVVFVLVILLASMNLVQRDDFVEQAKAEAETARINAELEATRAQAEKVLEPRRRAAASLKLLLERLEKKLAGQGVAVEIDPVAGRLSLDAQDLFSRNGVELTAGGNKVVDAFASVLGSELPCVSNVPAQTPDCAAYDGQTLKQAAVAMQPASWANAMPDVAAARPLAFLSGIVARQTSLAALSASDGGRLLTNASFVNTPPASVEPADADAPGPADKLLFDFQMQVK